MSQVNNVKFPKVKKFYLKEWLLDRTTKLTGYDPIQKRSEWAPKEASEESTFLLSCWDSLAKNAAKHTEHSFMLMIFIGTLTYSQYLK